jgi:hypothetical protein
MAKSKAAHSFSVARSELNIAVLGLAPSPASAIDVEKSATPANTIQSLAFM